MASDGGGEADGSSSEGEKRPTKTPGLDQFTIDLTAKAKSGGIDPVLGREAEVRQIVDILTRRRQNNPILTGEAGVGKTAVVEGFAQRIASGDVPEPLKNVQIRSLDLGLLQAGAGVKGEFENRLKGVIDEVKKSPTPIILFIDEAHTMIGAGGQAGQGDAANLLKPALARGELRTVAATTWAEYKKYFEKDAALARRFQVVKVEEPTDSMACRMLRGIVATLEAHHKVTVLDEAIVEAVKLSRRYIPARQLPDKGVSLLDTACAKVAIGQSSTPPAIEDLERSIDAISVETKLLQREQNTGAEHAEALAELNLRKKAFEDDLGKLKKKFEEESNLVQQIQAERATLVAVLEETEDNSLPGKDAVARREVLQSLEAKLKSVQGETPLVSPCVDQQTIAEVIAGWTGIPVGKMVSDEIQGVLELKSKLEDRVVGQSHALDVIAERIRTSRAGLTDPKRPTGVFLLAGTSGVGKTETALALTELLFGDESNNDH